MQGDAYGVLEVIRQAIAQETRSGAKIEYSYGEISDASSGYLVSAYLNGNYETTSEDFRVPGHLHVSAGDYAMFAVDHARGSKWLVEVLPGSLYAKLAIDINEGVLYMGDGTSPPSTPIVPGEGGGGDWIWEADSLETVGNVYEDDL